MRVGLSGDVQAFDYNTVSGLLGFAIAALSVGQNNMMMCFKIRGFMQAYQSTQEIYLYTLHSVLVRACSS